MIDILSVALARFTILDHFTPGGIALCAVFLLLFSALVLAVLFLVVTRHACYLPCCEGGRSPLQLEPRQNLLQQVPKETNQSAKTTG